MTCEYVSVSFVYISLFSSVTFFLGFLVSCSKVTRTFSVGNGSLTDASVYTLILDVATLVKISSLSVGIASVILPLVTLSELTVVNSSSVTSGLVSGSFVTCPLGGIVGCTSSRDVTEASVFATSVLAAVIDGFVTGTLELNPVNVFTFSVTSVNNSESIACVYCSWNTVSLFSTFVTGISEVSIYGTVNISFICTEVSNLGPVALPSVVVNFSFASPNVANGFVTIVLVPTSVINASVFSAPPSVNWSMVIRSLSFDVTVGDSFIVSPVTMSANFVAAVSGLGPSVIPVLILANGPFVASSGVTVVISIKWELL